MTQNSETERQTYRPGLLRIIASLTAAAIICAGLLGLLLTLLKLNAAGAGLSGMGTGLVLYSAIALFLALPVALLLGGPLYWWLSRRRAPAPGALALVAGVLAVVPFLLLGRRAISPDEGLVGLIPLSALLFAVGAIGGLLFSLFAGLIRRRA